MLFVDGNSLHSMKKEEKKRINTHTNTEPETKTMQGNPHLQPLHKTYTHRNYTNFNATTANRKKKLRTQKYMRKCKEF